MKYAGRLFKCTCKNCGKEFKSNSNTTKYCPDCFEFKECCECHNLTEDKYPKPDDNIHICKKCRKEIFGEKKISICECDRCHTKFFSTSNRKKYCPNCIKHPVCNYCGRVIKEYEIVIDDDNPHYCNVTCSNRHQADENSKAGFCIVCGKYCDHRDALAQGVECGCSSDNLEHVRQLNQEPGECCCCHKIVESRDRQGRCKKCHDKWYDWQTHLPQVREQGDRNLREHHNNGGGITSKEWSIFDYDNLECTKNCKCKDNCPFVMLLHLSEKENEEIKKHIKKNKFGYCEVSANLIKKQSNFITKQGVKCYKGIPVDYLVRQILNKEVDIKDYPGFEIRCGRVCYYGVDVLIDEQIYLDYNFQVVNGVKFYKNTPVEEIVKGILNKTLDINDFPGFDIRLGRVCYRTRDILTNETIYLQQNFQTRDGVKFYKNEPVEVVISKLESGEYNTTENCPGWNKRFGEWYYGTVNVLTGEATTLNGSNFEVKDDIVYYLNKTSGEYEPWNEKVESELNRIKNIDPSEEERDFIEDEGFERFPIINNTDDPDMWNREQTDKALCEAGYGWIVYIKLFLGHPFIGGKTGTRAVSNSPIDFDFKVYDENNLDNPDYKGPGRIFIRQNYSNVKYTDHEYILVKGGFKNENEAIEYERYIIDKYNLFGS